MNKHLILIITISILLCVILINYKTIKTKLLNFKSSILGSNSKSSTTTPSPTTPSPTTEPPTTEPPTTYPPTTYPPTTYPPTTYQPTTTPPPYYPPEVFDIRSKVKVKNIVCNGTYTCSIAANINNVIDGLNTSWASQESNSFFNTKTNASEAQKAKLTFNFEQNSTINRVVFTAIGAPYYDPNWIAFYVDNQTAELNIKNAIYEFILPKFNSSSKKAILNFTKPYTGNSITIWLNNNTISYGIGFSEIDFFSDTTVTTNISKTTLSLSSGSKIPVKNIVGGNSASVDVAPWGTSPAFFISSIIDGNYDSVYYNNPSSYGTDPSYYIFTFIFDAIIKINKIILHSVDNYRFYAKKVILYRDQKSALDDENYGIQTFDIVSNTKNGETAGKYWGDATGPNAADFKSELLLSSPYIGDNITLRIYSSVLPYNDAIIIREIEFFA